MLSHAQILFLLDTIRDRYGPGYSDAMVPVASGETVSVGGLQARLSVMLEASARARMDREPHSPSLAKETAHDPAD